MGDDALPEHERERLLVVAVFQAISGWKNKPFSSCIMAFDERIHPGDRVGFSIMPISNLTPAELAKGVGDNLPIAIDVCLTNFFFNF